MTERQTRKVEISDGDKTWTFDEFRALLDSVPPEYAASGCVQHESGYADETDIFSVYYVRPETDEEVSARAARAAQSKKWDLDRDRAYYLALKARFEP